MVNKNSREWTAKHIILVVSESVPCQCCASPVMASDITYGQPYPRPDKTHATNSFYTREKMSIMQLHACTPEEKPDQRDW